MADRRQYRLLVFEREAGHRQRTRCDDELCLDDVSIGWCATGQTRLQPFGSVVEVRLRRILDGEWPAPAADCLIQFDDETALIIERQPDDADYGRFVADLHQHLCAREADIDFWQRSTPQEHARFLVIGIAVLLATALIFGSVHVAMILIAGFAALALFQKPKRYDPARIPARLM